MFQNHLMKSSISRPIIMLDVFYKWPLACYLFLKVLCIDVCSKLRSGFIEFKHRRLLPSLFWKINFFILPRAYSSFNLFLITLWFYLLALQDHPEMGCHLKCT